jgi:hypothetical protein
MNEVSVRYESASGEFKTINVPLDETMTVITDFKPGGAIEATTRHLPSETALDPVVLTAEATFPSAYELSKRGWSIVVSDSLNRADTPGGIGIIDGDINVMWHSNLSVAHPHRIEIDMKGTKVISRFEICQSPSYAYTKIFAVRFSVDNVNWSEAVNLVYPNNSAANARQSLLFDTPVEARYARIETVENFAAGNIYAMIMEVYVYGHD